MIKLRPIQKQKATELVDIIDQFNIALLSGETRSGKSLTALKAVDLLGKKDVLFVSKKKALSSIRSDYEKAGFGYELTLINYASVHKIERNDFDFVIYDESHSCFLGETEVEGVKIKDINLGDSIKTFNLAKNRIEKNEVVNKFEKELTENLIKIKANGKEIICTESHEIFTEKGWKKAKDITTKDYVYFLR